MNLRSAIAVVAIGLLPASAGAHPHYLFGQIGSAPVLLKLERNADKLSGWYLYLRVAKEIRVDGGVDAKGAFRLEEFDNDSGHKTGSFSGTVKSDSWSGIWRRPDGSSALAFSARETADTLAGMSDALQCRAKKVDTQFGWTFTQDLKLKVVRGQVKQFDHELTAKSLSGDEHGCLIGAKYLQQQKSDAGILLHAKETGDVSGLHCSVRIIANADWLEVEMGDPSGSNDDCKGAGDTMFCSPSAGWADLVVNRKSRTCRIEE